MRRYLVIFMLLLLPLRGWVGDAMAYSMLATGQLPAQEAAAHPCHTEPAAADDSAQSQCSSCQVCHLSAATPLQLPSGMLPTSAVLPAQRPAHWISADPRLLAKTPVV